MGASTKQIDTTPAATQQLRDPLVSWLGGTQSAAQQSAQPSAQQLANLQKYLPNQFQQWQQAQQAQQQVLPPGGPQPAGANPFDRIFTSMPQSMDRTELAPTPNIDPMNRGGIRDIMFDPAVIQMLGLGNIPMVGGGAGTDPFQRGQVRDVSGGSTQSVDQLGGANSAFFQNMMAQLQPAFTNQRNLGLASAKESAGNLTGSGFGNILGSAVNRSLGDEQARLADYAVQGMGMEMNRQQGDANRNLQAGMANQGADLGFLGQLLGQSQIGQQGQMANQDAVLRAMMANQGASISGAQLGQQAGLANQGMDQSFMGMDLQRMLANQGTQAAVNSQQGNLDQQRIMQQYLTQAGIGQGNASNFLQLLLGQSLAGVSPNTIQQSGGIGGFLGPVLGGVLGSVGGPIGTAIGTKIGGKVTGGGK